MDHEINGVGCSLEAHSVYDVSELQASQTKQPNGIMSIESGIL